MTERHNIPAIQVHPAYNVERHHVLLVSLSRDRGLHTTFPYLIAALSEHADVAQAKGWEAVDNYLEETTPRAVIVTDDGISSPARRRALGAIRRYLRNGGLVIFACHFGRLMISYFDRWWNEVFDLNWTRGGKYRLRCEPTG
jgi:hypothetical protein